MSVGPDGQPITEPVSRVPPNLLEQVLSEVPDYQSLEKVVAGGATYDTTNLGQLAADKITGNTTGIIVDPATGEPLYPTAPGELAASWFGTPSIPFGQQSYQERLNTATLQALKAWYAAHSGVGAG